MAALLNWLDDRTGCRDFVHEALYERIPGGARWRYVWGSTLVMTFMTQVITGLFLWMFYSPGAQSAWESIYYIQHQVSAGSLVRGIHHYAAQAIVVLLGIHLLQVVIDGAYRAPREFNFWIGLILMKLMLGLALTGYLLPWDQKGFWATQVATKIAGIVPVVGPTLQQLVVGGTEYGHLTLTRFFALHAGVLPALLVLFLVLHIMLFRKHGIHAHPRPDSTDETFWPRQVLLDGLACLAILAMVVLLAMFVPAELGAPSDPAVAYDAARPEWYFLFLFQFLKYFPGELELVGAVIVPGAIMFVLFLLPLIGRWRVGHWFSVLYVMVLLIGAGVLTGLAWWEDHQANFMAVERFQELQQTLDAIENDQILEEEASRFHGLKDDQQKLEAYFEEDQDTLQRLLPLLQPYEAFLKSRNHLAAVAQAEFEAERAHHVMARPLDPSRPQFHGPGPAGAAPLIKQDPGVRGLRLFRTHCVTCHNFEWTGTGPQRWPDVINDRPTAPNLYGFASREWLATTFDPDAVANRHRFGYLGSPFADGEMVGFIRGEFEDLADDERQALEQELSLIATVLSAEAALPYQREQDLAAAGEIEEGHALLAAPEVLSSACTDCHKFHDEDPEAGNPDLTGYGSREWLIAFLSNPAHERFYGEANDRMPAFAPAPEDAASNRLTADELEALADFLRGDWYEHHESSSPAGNHDQQAAPDDPDSVASPTDPAAVHSPAQEEVGAAS